MLSRSVVSAEKVPAAMPQRLERYAAGARERRTGTAVICHGKRWMETTDD